MEREELLQSLYYAIQLLEDNKRMTVNQQSALQELKKLYAKLLKDS